MPNLAAELTGLPPPSAELVLYRVHVEATIAVLGRKKAERYLRIMSAALAEEESLSSVFNIRPNSQHAEVRLARLQASSIFQRFMPVFLARLPSK